MRPEKRWRFDEGRGAVGDEEEGQCRTRRPKRAVDRIEFVYIIGMMDKWLFGECLVNSHQPVSPLVSLVFDYNDGTAFIDVFNAFTDADTKAGVGGTADSNAAALLKLLLFR